MVTAWCHIIAIFMLQLLGVVHGSSCEVCSARFASALQPKQGVAGFL